MSTVYVVQNQMRRNAAGDLEPAFDLAPAREYGRLVFLLQSGPVPLEPASMVKKLSEALQTFNSDVDYLIAVGSPVAITAAVAIVSCNCSGVVPLLVWDRIVRRYNAVTVDLHNRS